MITNPGIILFGKKIGLPETPKTTDISPFAAAMENTEDAIADSHEHTLFTPHDQPKDESDEEGMSENPQTTDGDTMKKPDKILPCPRCDSMDTKFCYFNNSNVNQPRHFCKSCQRYWTAGGTMRNMPVGAGRRKKKNPPPICRYILSQESFESEFAPDSDGIQPKILSFGQNLPHFETSGKENRDEGYNGFHSHFHGIPIPIPIPIPPIYAPGYPQIPIYPSPYWNSVSWISPTNSILGKHPTDGEAIKPNGSEFKKQRNSILIPKTLRIHDPDEAAKSSIWATLGIKNEHSGRGDFFKAFQSKGIEKKKNKATEPSPVLQANPAAFSRSICFQERA